VLAGYENGEINFNKIFAKLEDLTYRARLDREFYTKYKVFWEKSLREYKEKLKEDVKDFIENIEKVITKEEYKVEDLIKDVKQVIRDGDRTVRDVDKYISYVRKYSIFKVLFDKLLEKYGNEELLRGKILNIWNRIWRIVANLWMNSLKLKMSEEILSNQIKLKETDKMENQRQILEKLSIYQNVLDLIKQVEEEIKRTEKILWEEFERYLEFVKGEIEEGKVINIILWMKEELKDILNIDLKNFNNYWQQKNRIDLLKKIEKELNEDIFRAYNSISEYVTYYGPDDSLSNILNYINEKNIYENIGVEKLLKRCVSDSEGLLYILNGMNKEEIFVWYIEKILQKIKDKETIGDDINYIIKVYNLLNNKDWVVNKYIAKMYNFFVKWELWGWNWELEKMLRKIKEEVHIDIKDILNGDGKKISYYLKNISEWYLTGYANLIQWMKEIIQEGYSLLKVLKLSNRLQTEQEKQVYNMFVNENKDKIQKKLMKLVEEYITNPEDIDAHNKLKENEMLLKKYLGIVDIKYLTDEIVDAKIEKTFHLNWKDIIEISVVYKNGENKVWFIKEGEKEKVRWKCIFDEVSDPVEVNWEIYYEAEYKWKSWIIKLWEEDKVEEKCIFDEIWDIGEINWEIYYIPKYDWKRWLLKFWEEEKDKIIWRCIFGKIKKVVEVNWEIYYKAEYNWKLWVIKLWEEEKGGNMCKFEAIWDIVEVNWEIYYEAKYNWKRWVIKMWEEEKTNFEERCIFDQVLVGIIEKNWELSYKVKCGKKDLRVKLWEEEEAKKKCVSDDKIK